MDRTTIHVVILMAVSLFSIAVVIRLARTQKLTFRYAVGWITLGVFGLISSFAIPVVEPIAEALSLTPIAIVAGVAVLILIVICIQLSISISGLQRQIRLMTEEVAFLQFELDSHLEQSEQS
jgi:hypothetical protein